jgi:hypothetical protein
MGISDVKGRRRMQRMHGQGLIVRTLVGVPGRRLAAAGRPAGGRGLVRRGGGAVAVRAGHRQRERQRHALGARSEGQLLLGRGHEHGGGRGACHAQQACQALMRGFKRGDAHHQGEPLPTRTSPGYAPSGCTRRAAARRLPQLGSRQNRALLTALRGGGQRQGHAGVQGGQHGGTGGAAPPWCALPKTECMGASECRVQNTAGAQRNKGVWQRGARLKTKSMCTVV